MEMFQTIVVGAGIAGLSAARRIAEAGRRVLVLEAQERIGGRLLTLEQPSLALPIELGAEFVHGRPPDLLALIAEAGLRLYELNGDHFCFESGRLGRCEQEEAFSVLTEMESYRGPDISFADYLRDRDVSPRAWQKATGYVEGFNAAYAGDISVEGLIRQQQAEDAIEGDRLFRIREGYLKLAEYQWRKCAQAGAVLRCGAPVERVEWSRGVVSLTTRAGEVFHAEQAVIAVPLGVLQAQTIAFAPVPNAALQAVRLLAMGNVNRLVLHFRERFWAADPERAKLSFLFADSGEPRTWWTPFPNQAPTLTGWAGGRQADQAPEGGARVTAALEQLARVFGATPEGLRRALESWHLHDWQHDPWTRGAYSYPRVGGANASAALSQPVDSTLFFAGEHTDVSGHWGTVHGGYRSGLRAAAQVLQAHAGGTRA